MNPINIHATPALLQTCLRHRIGNLVAEKWLSCERTGLVKQNYSYSKSSSINKTQTYYDLFPKSLASGPPPSGAFDINIKALHQEFLKLQAMVHPDRHTGKSKPVEYDSALVNEAYKTLKNPLSRAQYLLSLRNIDMREDEVATDEVEIEFLDEIMKIREAIDDTDPKDIAALTKLKNQNNQKIQLSESLAGRAFEADDWQKAKTFTIRLKYLMNINFYIEKIELNEM